MNHATPQRTVSISLTGRQEDDTQIAYSYWSPNDGLTRIASPTCDLYQKNATNTLFVLDYASALNGWTIVRTEPNPPDSPALESIRGPKNTSLMTMFPELHSHEVYNFYIVYKNEITDQTVKFDPQEGNIPP
ncbi:MAG: hypothetical protein ACJ8LG_07325 [Massilia sp.]